MIPKHERVVSSITRSNLDRNINRDERAVSEVLGVIMMLAMVISIMGGVWVFLNPYLSDFEDNTNWNKATGIADRLEDRIDVVGDSPESTGIRHKLSMQKSILQGTSNSEIWSISADLVSTDQVVIRTISGSSIGIMSINETARKVSILTENGNFEELFSATQNEVQIQHDIILDNWYIITVYDGEDIPIHRSMTYPISGLKILTTLATGVHEINLVNNARIEHFSSNAWDISKYPTVEFDTLANRDYRLTILLTNIDVNGTLGFSSSLAIDIISSGTLSVFSGECYNIRYSMSNSVSAVITPQYNQLWLSDYYLNRASGTLDSFVGLVPFERSSGHDGITVETLGAALHLEVHVQQVVLER
jgi:flagellin-like protein